MDFTKQTKDENIIKTHKDKKSLFHVYIQIFLSGFVLL